jgi:hypothetical protein
MRALHLAFDVDLDSFEGARLGVDLTRSQDNRKDHISGMRRMEHMLRRQRSGMDHHAPVFEVSFRCALGFLLRDRETLLGWTMSGRHTAFCKKPVSPFCLK